jgi:hypothetical protein
VLNVVNGVEHHHAGDTGDLVGDVTLLTASAVEGE